MHKSMGRERGSHKGELAGITHCTASNRGHSRPSQFKAILKRQQNVIARRSIRKALAGVDATDPETPTIVVDGNGYWD